MLKVKEFYIKVLSEFDGPWGLPLINSSQLQQPGRRKGIRFNEVGEV